MNDDFNPDLTPEEKRRQLGLVSGHTAASLRLMSAMAAGEQDSVMREIAEIDAAGNGLTVVAAIAAMAARLAYELGARTGTEAQDWLDRVALGLLDQADETAAARDDEGNS